MREGIDKKRDWLCVREPASESYFVTALVAATATTNYVTAGKTTTTKMRTAQTCHRLRKKRQPKENRILKREKEKEMRRGNNIIRRLEGQNGER